MDRRLRQDRIRSRVKPQAHALKHVRQSHEILAFIRLFQTCVTHVAQRKFHPTTVLLSGEAPTQLLGEVQARSVELIGFGLVRRADADEQLQAGAVDQAPVQTPASREFKSPIGPGQCFTNLRLCP